MKKLFICASIALLLPLLSRAQDTTVVATPTQEEIINQNRIAAIEAQDTYESLRDGSAEQLQALDERIRELKEAADHCDGLLRRARADVQNISNIRREQSRYVSNLRREGAPSATIAYERDEYQAILKDLTNARQEVRELDNQSAKIKRELSSVKKEARTIRNEISKAKSAAKKQHRILKKSMKDQKSE